MSQTSNRPKPMYNYKATFFTAGFPASDNFLHVRVYKNFV